MAQRRAEAMAKRGASHAPRSSHRRSGAGDTEQTVSSWRLLRSITSYLFARAARTLDPTSSRYVRPATSASTGRTDPGAELSQVEQRVLNLNLVRLLVLHECGYEPRWDIAPDWLGFA